MKRQILFYLFYQLFILSGFLATGAYVSCSMGLDSKGETDPVIEDTAVTTNDCTASGGSATDPECLTISTVRTLQLTDVCPVSSESSAATKYCVFAEGSISESLWTGTYNCWEWDDDAHTTFTCNVGQAYTGYSIEGCTTEATLAAAINTAKADGVTSAILILGSQGGEPIDLASLSDTDFIGCDSANAEIRLDNATGSVTSNGEAHLISMDSTSSNLRFSHLTLGGVESYTSSANATANSSTVYINGATGFSFDDVTIQSNLYQAVLIRGTASGTMNNITLSPPMLGEGDYAMNIGIWNEGDLTISGTIGGSGAFDMMVVNNEGALTLGGTDGLTIGADYDVGTVVYSTSDSGKTVATSSASLSGSNYSLIGCNPVDDDSHPENYLYNFENSIFPSVLAFGAVTVSGSGNDLSGGVQTDGTTSFNGQFSSIPLDEVFAVCGLEI